MSFNSKPQEYYYKFLELQEKLRRSEEERLKLEIKFNEMVQSSREEEKQYYRKMKHQYKNFVESERQRMQRNEHILQALERIETRISMLSAKTERLKLLRQQYQSFLRRTCGSSFHQHANPNHPSERLTENSRYSGTTASQYDTKLSSHRPNLVDTRQKPPDFGIVNIPDINLPPLHSFVQDLQPTARNYVNPAEYAGYQDDLKKVQKSKDSSYFELNKYIPPEESEAFNPNYQRQNMDAYRNVSNRGISLGIKSPEEENFASYERFDRGSEQSEGMKYDKMSNIEIDRGSEYSEGMKYGKMANIEGQTIETSKSNSITKTDDSKHCEKLESLSNATVGVVGSEFTNTSVENIGNEEEKLEELLGDDTVSRSLKERDDVQSVELGMMQYQPSNDQDLFVKSEENPTENNTGNEIGNYDEVGVNIEKLQLEPGMDLQDKVQEDVHQINDKEEIIEQEILPKGAETNELHFKDEDDATCKVNEAVYEANTCRSNENYNQQEIIEHEILPEGSGPDMNQFEDKISEDQTVAPIENIIDENEICYNTEQNYSEHIENSSNDAIYGRETTIEDSNIDQENSDERQDQLSSTKFSQSRQNSQQDYEQNPLESEELSENTEDPTMPSFRKNKNQPSPSKRQNSNQPHYSQNGQYYDRNGQPINYQSNPEQVQYQYDEKGQPYATQYDPQQQQYVQYDDKGQPYVQYDENAQQYDENGQPYNQQYYENDPNYANYNQENQEQYDEQQQQYDQYRQQEYQNSEQADYSGSDQQQYDPNGQYGTYYAEVQYNQNAFYPTEETQESQQNPAQEENATDNNRTQLMDMLETDTENSSKQDNHQVSNDSDFDYSKN